jgi:hypothetical protein
MNCYYNRVLISSFYTCTRASSIGWFTGMAQPLANLSCAWMFQWCRCPANTSVLAWCSRWSTLVLAWSSRCDEAVHVGLFDLLDMPQTCNSNLYLSEFVTTGVNRLIGCSAERHYRCSHEVDISLLLKKNMSATLVRTLIWSYFEIFLPCSIHLHSFIEMCSMAWNVK